MPSSLQSTIQSLAESLAAEIISTIRSMSLDELAALGGRGAPHRAPGLPKTHGGQRRARGRSKKAHAAASSHAPSKRSKRLARRSEADLTKMVGKIVELVKAAKNGINAEDLRKKLGIERKELPRPLQMALASKKVRKTGQKRATKYFAGGMHAARANGAGKKAAPKTAAPKKAAKMATSRKTRRTKKAKAHARPKGKTHAKAKPAKKAAKGKPSPTANGAAKPIAAAAAS